MSPLVEREGQLATLASAAAEGGRLVFVGGEARVSARPRSSARSRPSRRTLLRGSYENLGTPTPLAPFVGIAAETGGAFATVLADAPEPRAVA